MNGINKLRIMDPYHRRFHAIQAKHCRSKEAMHFQVQAEASTMRAVVNDKI
jgi:hypothetical protein